MICIACFSTHNQTKKDKAKIKARQEQYRNTRYQNEATPEKPTKQNTKKIAE